MKKTLGFALCLLGTALMILSGILMSVEHVGTDAELYYRLQTEAQVLERYGISNGDLLLMNDGLARCLMGDGEILKDLRGEFFPGFNEKELIHMEDCRRLFMLARTVKTAALLSGSAMLIAGIIMLKDRRRINLASGLGPLALIVPLGILAGWAMIDFNSAFNFFHEILFTNDLWLLNPATDWLIRICPQSMFMNMGMRIGIMSLIFALAVPLAMMIITFILSKAKLIDNGDVK